MANETIMQELGIDKNAFPAEMNLRLAAVYLNLSEQRVRTLARDETVPGATKDESGQWVFSKQGLNEYLTQAPKARGGGGPRGNSKKWVVDVKHADLDKVKAALKPFGIELEPRYNYQKQKEYRQKRAAAQKAAEAKKKAS